jgi:hypothetical protein
MNKLIITKAHKGKTLVILAQDKYKHKNKTLHRITNSQ